jgi:aminoglycoside phosphotransferase
MKKQDFSGVVDIARNGVDRVIELESALQTAIWRIEDMLKADDGQAWKEAEKALPNLKATLGESK